MSQWLQPPPMCITSKVQCINLWQSCFQNNLVAHLTVDQQWLMRDGEMYWWLDETDASITAACANCTAWPTSIQWQMDWKTDNRRCINDITHWSNQASPLSHCEWPSWSVLCVIVAKGRFPLPEFTARVHGPSWRPENSSAFFDARQLGPWTRVVETDFNSAVIDVSAVHAKHGVDWLIDDRSYRHTQWCYILLKYYLLAVANTRHL